MINVARKYPELILFLDLYETVIVANIKPLSCENTNSITTAVSAEIQTETHPIEYAKEKKYFWNIWDLRRKAIKLADLRMLQTHSTQTNQSVYRQNFGTQTYVSITKTSQTTKESSSSTEN